MSGSSSPIRVVVQLCLDRGADVLELHGEGARTRFNRLHAASAKDAETLAAQRLAFVRARRPRARGRAGFTKSNGTGNHAASVDPSDPLT